MHQVGQQPQVNYHFLVFKPLAMNCRGMKLLFCLVLIPLFAAWNYISVAVQWCPQFCCLSPQFCRLYHHNMFVLKFLNSHCWLNMIMKSTYLPMTIHILGLSENRASIHQKMQFDREHVESQQNFRVYPWRIHGAGRKMLTWLGYIDGIHVTIYSIHGSYGICSSVDFRQIQCLLIEYLQLFAQKNLWPAEFGLLADFPACDVWSLEDMTASVSCILGCRLTRLVPKTQNFKP